MMCALEPDDDAFNLENQNPISIPCHTFSVSDWMRWRHKFPSYNGTHNYKAINFRFAKYSMHTHRLQWRPPLCRFSHSIQNACAKITCGEAKASQPIVMVWLHIGFWGIFFATLGNTGNEKKKVVAASRNKNYTEFWNFSRIFAVSSGADARCMRPASSFVLLTGILRVYALRFRCLLCTLYGLTTGRCRRPGHCVVYVSTFNTARSKKNKEQKSLLL